MKVSFDPNTPDQRNGQPSTRRILAGTAVAFLIGVVALRFGLGTLESVYQAATSSAAPTAACSTSDIRILQADHYPPTSNADPYGHIVGEAANDCDGAAGVEIRITLRDQTGRVMASEEQWLAATANIPPHTTFPFSTVVSEVVQNPPPKMQIVVEHISRPLE
jgi:hypothetical protein